MLVAAEHALKQDDREVVDTCLRDIVEAAQRCAAIVHSILQLARADHTQRSPVDLTEIVSRACELTLDFAAQRGVSLSCEPADLPVPVVANATAITQVLVNVIRNSVEACGDRGSIRIGMRQESDRAIIVVEDNGCGMTERDRRHACDPFFSTRKDRGGTGLGLSISHGVVSDHGGTLEISSQPGAGTAVTIDLPVGDAEPRGHDECGRSASTRPHDGENAVAQEAPVA